MAAPHSGTTTPLQWSISYVRVKGINVTSARLDVELFIRSIVPGRQVITEQGWILRAILCRFCWDSSSSFLSKQG